MTIASGLRVRQPITSVDQLRELVGEPSERARQKQLARLDVYCRAFIARSPFVLMGTADASGRCDVSPKGDRPGFVLVPDEETLVIPDRPGNRRFDSLQNLIANPRIGLLFLIPGMSETLRVNGQAELARDDDLLDQLAVDRKQPWLAIEVRVEEAFLHCGKAMLRSQLWDPARHMPREQLPSLSRMIQDQIRPLGIADAEQERVVAAAECATDEAYQKLY
ncbi:MAG: pyridoxamine 5'-phosphate oxidase family protein [Chloroflexi bacterium]|nr:pyridoxamine 5'-phosphate oxidase family protein [Chloroflexota bacterium]